MNEYECGVSCSWLVEAMNKKEAIEKFREFLYKNLPTKWINVIKIEKHLKGETKKYDQNGRIIKQNTKRIF